MSETVAAAIEVVAQAVDVFAPQIGVKDSVITSFDTAAAYLESQANNTNPYVAIAGVVAGAAAIA